MTSGADEEVRPAVIPSGPVTPARLTTRPWARGLALLVYALLLATVVALRGVPSDSIQIVLWCWLATIAWNIEAPPRAHLGFVRDWWGPVAVLVVYFYTRGLADELGIPVHWTMPITFDAWLGGGETPTRHLQDALCGNPCNPTSEPRWYDLAFTLIYTSHFLVGLVLALVLWMRNRVAWKQWMRRYVGIFLAGLVIYVVYPMAPPWMASDAGLLPSEVHRLTSRGWAGLDLHRYHAVLTGVGNPVAAMPSLHAGLAFLVAFFAISRLRTPWRWALLAYPVAMSVGLVYDGEHYVIDILAGAALAGVVMAVSSWWERSRGD